MFLVRLLVCLVVGVWLVVCVQRVFVCGCVGSLGSLVGWLCVCVIVV